MNKAHRLLHYLTLGSTVKKKKNKRPESITQNKKQAPSDAHRHDGAFDTEPRPTRTQRFSEKETTGLDSALHHPRFRDFMSIQ